MREEYLKVFMREAKRKKDPERIRWDLAVILVQVTFRYGNVPEEVAWATMVLLPKGEGLYWGISMVEILWKVCSVVVNFCLKLSVRLHDVLHGFREGQGAGMDTLEANLEQQPAELAHDPLFQVFLYVRKAYYSLNREGCLEILRGYGLGLSLSRLLKN